MTGDKDLGVVFERLTTELFIFTTQINQLKKCARVLGTSRDTEDARQRVSDYLEVALETSRRLSGEIKHVLEIPDSGAVRLKKKKFSADFSCLLSDFERVQKDIAAKQQNCILKDRKVLGQVNQELQDLEREKYAPTQPLVQTSQRMIYLDAQQEQNEQLIREREEKLVVIQDTILEVNDIFNDLSQMLSEQSIVLDNIDTSIANASLQTEQGTLNLDRAHNHQKRSYRRLRWVAGILLFIVVFMSFILYLLLKN